MRRRALALLAIPGLMLAITACGPKADPCDGCAEPVTPAASARSGNLLVIADPRSVTAGQTIRVSVTVTGPADYDAGCVQTVRIWALNSAAVQVWQQVQPEIMCYALTYRHLDAGQAATFAEYWPVAQGTPAGKYTIHGLFMFHLPPGAGARVRENLPPVTVNITG